MSVEAMTWVFKHSPYTLGARLVHLALADVANDGYDYRLWLPHSTIAAKAKVSERAVRSAVKQMVADGYLEEVAKPRGKPVEYRLLMPETTASTPEVTSGVGDATPEENDTDPGRNTQSHYLSTQEELNAPEEQQKRREREHDLAWDALVAALGWEPKTKAEKSRVGKAVREIATALPDGTTREDVGKHITARAARYRTHWPRAELTPEALVKHWSKFAPGAHAPDAPARPAAAPERGTLTEAEHLRRKDPADRTWAEFVKSLEGLGEADREVEKRSRRDGLRERIFMQTGEAPTRETGWFYEEGEAGWQKVQGQGQDGKTGAATAADVSR